MAKQRHKSTSEKVAKIASKLLRDNKSSAEIKSAAASALAQKEKRKRK